MKYSEYDCMSSCRKREYAVSSVIGVVLLLAMVVAVGAVAALIVSSDVSGKASFAPQVIFEPSADEYLLYHAGGDRLYRGDLIISWEGKDITANTSLVIPAELTGDILTKLVSGSPDIESSKSALDFAWENWSTGQALMAFKPDGVNTPINVSEIQISANANGRLYAIYIGSSYVDGGYVPVIPTVTPGPAPTDKRFDITIEPCVYAAIKPYLTPEGMWLPWSGTTDNWRDGKNGHGVNVTVGPRNGSMIQNMTVEYVNDAWTNAYNVKKTFISGNDEIINVVFTRQESQRVITTDGSNSAYRSGVKTIPSGNVLTFVDGDALGGRNIFNSYKPGDKSGNPRSYEFYVANRGSSGRANIPDTTDLSRRADLNITSGNIRVKIGYIDNGVSGYEYYWLNKTFIPPRAVNLNNADLMFTNKSYVTDYGVRGIELKLTGGANASEAAFYTVQGVSGDLNGVPGGLNGVVLDYAGSDGGVTINKPDTNKAGALTGQTYRYSIPEELDNKEAIPDAEFLVTTYMWNGSAWWSNETVIKCEIQAPPHPSDELIYVVNGYYKGDFETEYRDRGASSVFSDGAQGHGVNVYILNIPPNMRGGSIKVDMSVGEKKFTTYYTGASGGDLPANSLRFDINEDDDGMSRKLADYSALRTTNDVHTGDSYFFYIDWKNPANQFAIPNAKVNVTLTGAGGSSYQSTHYISIPARYYTSAEFNLEEVKTGSQWTDNPPAGADYVVNMTGGVANVTFEPTATGTILSYDWTMGDQKYTSRVPEFTFTAPGIYRVDFYIKNTTKISDKPINSDNTSFRTIEIIDPDARTDMIPLTIQANANITTKRTVDIRDTTNYAASDYDNIKKWVLDYGDGNSYDVTTPSDRPTFASHLYDLNGADSRTFTLNYTVYYNAGGYTRTSTQVTVHSEKEEELKTALGNYTKTYGIENIKDMGNNVPLFGVETIELNRSSIVPSGGVSVIKINNTIEEDYRRDKVDMVRYTVTGTTFTCGSASGLTTHSVDPNSGSIWTPLYIKLDNVPLFTLTTDIYAKDGSFATQTTVFRIT